MPNIDKILVEYDLKLQAFEKDIKKVQSDLKKTEKQGIKSASGIQQGFKNTSRQLKTLILQFVALGGAIMAIRNSIKIVAEFEKSIKNLSAITGAVGKDLEFLRDKAIEISQATTQSAKDVVEGFKLVGSAKPELLKSGAALAEVTKQAILLSEASGMDLNQSVLALTDTLNQFSLGAEEAARVANALAAGSKFGAAEVNNVSAAIVGFGTGAKSANVSVEQSVALIELLAEKGLKGADAGIKLRNILLILQTQTKNYKDGVFDLNTALENLEPIMDNTIELNKMFGRQNVNAAQAVAQNRDRIQELTELLTDTNTVTEQAAINNDSLSASWKRLGNAWETFVISGEGGAKFLQNLVDGVRKRLILLGTDLVTFWEKFSLSADESFKLYEQRLKELNKTNEERLELLALEEGFDVSGMKLKLDALKEENEEKKKALKLDDEKEKKDETLIEKRDRIIKSYIEGTGATWEQVLAINEQVRVEEALNKEVNLLIDNLELLNRLKNEGIQSTQKATQMEGEFAKSVEGSLNMTQRAIDKQIEESDAVISEYDRRSAIFNEFASGSLDLLRSTAKSKKNVAVAEASVSYFQSLIEIWAKTLGTNPLFGTPIAIALSGLMTGVYMTNLANIQKQQFKKGGYVGDGNPNEIGGITHKGEFVQTAEKTKTYYSELEAMHTGKYEALIFDRYIKPERQYFRDALKGLTGGSQLTDKNMVRHLRLGNKMGIVNTDRIIRALQKTRKR